MSSLKPITLWAHATGPNPWKVAIVLEELGIPYETKFLEMPDMKGPEFTKINVNGRVPAIQDPNNGGFAIWESGAIIQYLVEKYDTEGKLSYKDGGNKKFEENQWLQFQMSGQGPYMGQAAWFSHFHSEQLPSARQRYIKEISRIMSVLDNHLKGKHYLVGDKCTYADLAFIPWHNMIPFILKGDKLEDEGQYKDYDRWMNSLLERPAVKKVLADKQKKMAEKH